MAGEIATVDRSNRRQSGLLNAAPSGDGKSTGRARVVGRKGANHSVAEMTTDGIAD